jgi:transposase
MLDLFGLVLGMLWVACRGRHALVVENLLLRQQLALALRSRRRPRLTRRDRLSWVLARGLTGEWRRHLVLVSPDTVVRWHRRGWRPFWRWRSRTRLGRPHLPAEVRELIATMSRQNDLWGTERLRGELRKLGIEVSTRSIRCYRSPGSPRPPSQTWRTFITNHAHAIRAADLFVVQTLTFRTLYVLLFITHRRRELVHLGVTAHPTAAWVWRRLAEATPWAGDPST